MVSFAQAAKELSAWIARRKEGLLERYCTALKGLMLWLAFSDNGGEGHTTDDGRQPYPTLVVVWQPPSCYEPGGPGTPAAEYRRRHLPYSLSDPGVRLPPAEPGASLCEPLEAA